MSPDSQHVKIEQTRIKIRDWQLQQPDFNHHLDLITHFWLRSAMTTLGMTRRDLVIALGKAPAADALRNLMSEKAFGNEFNNESMFDQYMLGPGQNENGLSFRYLRRLANTSFSLWRVVSFQSGASLTLTRWEGGPALTVHDRVYSKRCKTGDLLVALVIDMPAGPILGAGVLNFGNLDVDAATVSRIEAMRHLLSSSVIALLGPTAKPKTADEATSPDDASQLTGVERDRLLDRARKLYAMAQQSVASPHEAEIALRRCQSLMAKYGISEADLETSAFGNVEFTKGRTVPMHVKFLAAAKLHDVLFVTGRGGFAEFRGYEVDANVAHMTLDYLLDAVERALSARKRAGNFPAGRSAAYDYRVGFATEVSSRVEQLVAEREEEQQRAAGTGTALMVRKREIVRRKCGQDLISSSFHEPGTIDTDARLAGQTDGAKVSLDQQVESASFLALPGK